MHKYQNGDRVKAGDLIGTVEKQDVPSGYMLAIFHCQFCYSIRWDNPPANRLKIEIVAETSLQPV